MSLLLWAGVLAAIPLIGVRWVDSSESMVLIVAVAVAGMLLVAVVARGWRVSVLAGAALDLCGARDWAGRIGG